jgi:hypothetical protein
MPSGDPKRKVPGKVKHKRSNKTEICFCKNVEKKVSRLRDFFFALRLATPFPNLSVNLAIVGNLGMGETPENSKMLR